MSGLDEGKSLPAGEQLVAAGWRQGSLFSLSSACVCSNAPAGPESEDPVEVKKRKLKPGEKLVVAS